ncbi:MAG: ABC transporter permease [Eubacteriales bacterium]
MRKLLSANFARLWKEKMFWLAVVFVTIGSVFFSWMSYNTAMKYTDQQYYVEEMMFNMLPAIGFVFVFLISMRLGTEFDEHTIRNKLIVGYNRTQVYFAEYITCLTASLILLSAMLLFSGVSGYIFFREFQTEWTNVAFLVLCCALIASVFSAINVGICMNVRGKAASLVVSIIFLFAILLLASYCLNALAEEPTTYSYVSVTMDGGVEFGDLIDNPAYVEGNQRKIYELIADILPTGQTIQLNDLDCERAARWPVLSVVMLIITTVAGYMPFRKRDII